MAVQKKVPPKIPASSHQSIAPRAVPFPVRRIMQNESRTTYAPLNPFARINSFIALVLVVLFAFFTAYLIFGKAVGMFSIPSWIIFVSLGFLMLPAAVASLLHTYYMLDTYRFSLQKDFLFVRRGTINPTYDLIPYENVQDAEVARGFIDRLIGTAHISVSTPASVLYISYINLADAERFHDDLLGLAQAHKGMAE